MNDEPNDRDLSDLIARLGALRDDEVLPPRDLWPAIDRRTRRRPWLRTLAQIAAAIAIFAAGMLAGRHPWSTPRQTERADIEIQHKGSQFVEAVAHLNNADPKLQLKGRDVALATVYGALYEIDRERFETVLRTVADSREETARRTAVRF
jgi:hypothetical protein